MGKSISWKEAKIEANLVQLFEKADKKLYFKQDTDFRRELIYDFQDGLKEQVIDKFNQRKNSILEEEEQKEVELNDPTNKIDDKQRKNMQAFLRGLGIYNPSLTTLNATLNSGVTPNLSSFTNTLGMLTKMDLQTQMAHDFYINSVGLDYIKIAQNDEVIKQNDKLIEQNDRIIQLLEQSIKN